MVANRAESAEDESYSDSSCLESSSSTNGKPRPPRTVAGRYKLGAKLGAGSYSEVYAATDKQTGETVAVKLEWQEAEKTDKLLNEAELYKELRTCVGVPKVRWSGSKGEYNIMVLDVLGPSLDDLHRKLKRFSVKSVAMIAKQMIDRLQHVHKCGILYRDIKPHNFLMGAGEIDSKFVYLIDFGLAKRYADAVTGEHTKIQKKKGWKIAGTVRYSSPNLHDGCEASRRDDLFALGYVMIHLVRGRRHGLPWLNVSSNDKQRRNDKIRQKKAETSDAELCKGLPRQFVDYFEYLRTLQFLDEPDYERLQRLMDAALLEENAENDFIFDWTPCAELRGDESVAEGRNAKRQKTEGAVSA